ncbi:hypothetical protein K4F52_008845 [Lecanicillium sp. MT-2017a]|nr:hypothetical protein K4F52_008845 [Lecanicillium sp. MT-2017a]
MASAKMTMPCPYSLHLELRAARVVPDSSFIFRYATEGDLPGMIELFNSGRASAYDVDQSNGSSALVVSCKYTLTTYVDSNSNTTQYAVDRGHVAVWRYLLSAGADRCLMGKAKHSAMDVACTKLFSLDRPKTSAERCTSVIAPNFLSALKEDFSMDEYLERMQFPSLHRIVLGIISVSLRDSLETSTCDLDAVDYQGRTALSWAAIRADDVSLRTLLEFGANPNLGALNGDRPLHYAARAEAPWCIQPLIDHGADVDARNAWQVSPIGYTMSHRDDIRYLKPLLAASADIELADKHGRTALVRAVNLNRPSIVQCLLESGARCVMDDVWGCAPLITAIERKSKQISHALLEYAKKDLSSTQLLAVLNAAKSAGDSSTIICVESLLARLSD